MDILNSDAPVKSFQGWTFTKFIENSKPGDLHAKVLNPFSVKILGKVISNTDGVLVLTSDSKTHHIFKCVDEYFLKYLYKNQKTFFDNDKPDILFDKYYDACVQGNNLRFFLRTVLLDELQLIEDEKVTLVISLKYVKHIGKRFSLSWNVEKQTEDDIGYQSDKEDFTFSVNSKLNPVAEAEKSVEKITDLCNKLKEKYNAAKKLSYSISQKLELSKNNMDEFDSDELCNLIDEASKLFEKEVTESPTIIF